MAHQDHVSALLVHRDHAGAVHCLTLSRGPHLEAGTVCSRDSTLSRIQSCETPRPSDPNQMAGDGDRFSNALHSSGSAVNATKPEG